MQGGGGGAGEWEQLEEEDDDTDQYIRTDEESKKLSVVWVRGRSISRVVSLYPLPVLSVRNWSDGSGCMCLRCLLGWNSMR